MPEGDSIHRLALRLRPLLVGRKVTAFEAHTIADADAATVVGHGVVDVEARGKNLLVRFDDGRALHIHLRMLGRLFVERPRSRFYRPITSRPQLRLAVEGTAIVGRRIPVLRLLKEGGEARAPDLTRLGPDLLAEEIDVAAAVRRLREEAKRPIGEALLLQRVVAGIGNIYKSETLFLEGVSPLAKVASLSDEVLTKLVLRARDLLRKNLGPGPRATRSTLAGSPYWVYGRRGKACFRCGRAITMTRQGAPPGRSTYHCPSCQRLAIP
jgi:endonuclease VIII